MSKTTIITIGLVSIAIGLGVPVACLYSVVTFGFNYITAAIIACAAIGIGGGILIVAIVNGAFEDEGNDRVAQERLRILRNQQRATIEEMDSIVKVLEEIKDVLKSVEE